MLIFQMMGMLLCLVWMDHTARMRQYLEKRIINAS